MNLPECQMKLVIEHEAMCDVLKRSIDIGNYDTVPKGCKVTVNKISQSMSTKAFHVDLEVFKPMVDPKQSNPRVCDESSLQGMRER